MPYTAVHSTAHHGHATLRTLYRTPRAGTLRTPNDYRHRGTPTPYTRGLPAPYTRGTPSHSVQFDKVWTNSGLLAKPWVNQRVTNRYRQPRSLRTDCTSPTGSVHLVHSGQYCPKPWVILRDTGWYRQTGHPWDTGWSRCTIDQTDHYWQKNWP